MTSLVEFLSARVAEDEAVAQAVMDDRPGNGSSDAAMVVARLPAAAYAHVVNFGPKRVLAECAAKRAIIDRWKWADEHHDWSSDQEIDWETAFGTLCDLAAIYTDHADYDPSWAV